MNTEPEQSDVPQSGGWQPAGHHPRTPQWGVSVESGIEKSNGAVRLTGPANQTTSTEPSFDKKAEPRKSWWRRLWPPLLLAVLLAAIGLLAWQHDYVGDWFAQRGYHAPSSVRQLAQDDTMTDYARRLFYANKPQIDGRTTFNRNCPNNSDEVTVLGCFIGNRQGIFIYDVTDERLAGIQQVTAAHEMLHQGYERLSTKQRDHINGLLQAYYKTVTDDDLKAKIASYQKTEPHDVTDEMHSVFGTEVTNLPPELEQYYAQYFTDRHQVAEYHAKYQAAFTQRAQQIDSYDAQLASLKKQIDTTKAQIVAQEQSLQTQRLRLDQLQTNGQIAAYNAAVPGFNAQIDAYKALVAQTNTVIDQYNHIIDARNAIAVQEQQLQQAIDSSTVGPPH